MNEKPFHPACYPIESSGYDFKEGIPQSLLFHFHLIDRRIKYAILSFEPCSKVRTMFYVKSSFGRKFLSAHLFDDYWLSHDVAQCFPKVSFSIVLSNVIYP